MRLYSVDEVKRSARVRDIARRVDLEHVEFRLRSASISDSEVKKLQGVADAMERLLKKNPRNILIEGHTDAVGSDTANLALSDQRAEAVAEALTNAFGIAPENLTTQGYGERYLKVNIRQGRNDRTAASRYSPHHAAGGARRQFQLTKTISRFGKACRIARPLPAKRINGHATAREMNNARL